jgi:hypothetical protein
MFLKNAITACLNFLVGVELLIHLFPKILDVSYFLACLILSAGITLLIMAGTQTLVLLVAVIKRIRINFTKKYSRYFHFSFTHAFS